jgi:hypothetical protein
LQVNWKALDAAWHSELLSDPDNQHKEKFMIDLGLDPETQEQLYDLHPRRAQRGSTKSLLPIFRESQFFDQLKADNPNAREDLVCGPRQFAEHRCKCMRKRKASECDCYLHTEVEENLYTWHLARRGWHRALEQQAGGKPCDCHIHGRPAKMARQLTEAHLLERMELEEESAWADAGAAATEEHSDLGLRAEAAATALQELQAKAVPSVAKARAALEAAKARAQSYDGMSASLDALFKALMPCGRTAYPEISLTGGSMCKLYPRACTEDNCPRRGLVQLWGGEPACGWDHVFGPDCPVESSQERCSWQGWEQRLRGVNDEGKPSYSPEFIPMHGTRMQMLKELRAKVKKVMPHHARNVQMTHAARVFDDRRSGRHLDAANAAAAPLQLAAQAFAIVAKWAADAAAAAHAAAARVVAEASANAAASAIEAVMQGGGTEASAGQAAATEAAATATGHAASASKWIERRFIPQTLSLFARSAEVTAHGPSAKAAEAFAIRERLRTIAVVTSDYAAQLETQRKYTGTCASRERHNFLVSVVCYKPYKQLVKQQGSKQSRCEFEYKQHVDVFFAFHKAGFKPSARSFNVVQACMLFPLHACACAPPPLHQHSCSVGGFVLRHLLVIVSCCFWWVASYSLSPSGDR